jgi:hypothetical protein
MTREDWKAKLSNIWNAIIPVSWGIDMTGDWQEEVETILKDHCAEDAEIRRLALTVLPETDVNGSPKGVPSAVDIVEKLVEKIAELEKTVQMVIKNKINPAKWAEVPVGVSDPQK